MDTHTGDDATLLALVEQAPIGILKVRLDGKVTRANDTFAKILGIEHGDSLIGTNLRSYLDDPRPFEEAVNELLQMGAVRDKRTTIKTTTGNIRHLLYTASLEEETATGILVDVTDKIAADEERLRAEAGTRRLERLNAALIENAQDGISLLKADGTYDFISPSSVRITGWTLERFGNRSGLELVHPDDRQRVSMGFRSIIVEPEKEFKTEYRIYRDDGKEIWIESRFVNLLSDPDVRAIVNNYQDITERKTAQLALESVNRDLERRVEERTHELSLNRDKLSAANAALEKASRLKDEFLASMSHELRTPLTGILGLSEAIMLGTYGPLNERMEKALRGIQGSGKHLLELINDILDLSKIEADKLELLVEDCDAGNLCQASLQLVKGMSQSKRLRVGFSMSPPSLAVRADPRRLKQMLVNLLSNAVKFTAEGGEIGLEVTLDEERHAVNFTVWDRGIGIKDDDLGKLFQPFVQIDSSLARQYSGTGLGLSLVRRMAELHGGGVAVESEPGKGSRFCIRIPLAEGQERREKPEETVREGRDPTHALVIEDNLLDGEWYTQSLEGIGLPSIIHRTVKGALDLAAKLQPGAVILDLHLPDGFGLDLLKELKADERTRNIPVVVASIEERRGESLALGAAACLVKPFGREELRTVLRKAAGTAPSAEPVLVVDANRPSPLVMLADDSDLILETLGDFLRSRGWNLVTVRSGTELLEQAPALHPDLLLIDIQMPGLDGMETMRRLRAIDEPGLSSVPTIAVTALAMTGDRERCLAAGFDEYVSKPVELLKLDNLMRELLKHGRRQAQ